MTARELFQEWVKDLRSGNFKQGQRYLTFITTENKTEEHCCLGVLCKRLVTQNVMEIPEPHGLAVAYKFILKTDAYPHELDNSAILPLPLVDYLNDGTLSFRMTNDGSFPRSRLTPELTETIRRYWSGFPTPTSDVSLTQLNDEGVTFGVIADIIEHVYLQEVPNKES